MLQRLIYKYLGVPYRLSVRYDSKKGKQTIVLLHGIAASGEVWSSTYERLSLQYRVIVLDLLGFGASPKPEFLRYDVRDHARAVRKTLRRMGVGAHYMVGHSMGAVIALHYTHRYTKVVDGLLCVSMPGYDMSNGRKKVLIRYRMNGFIRLYTALINNPDLTFAAVNALVKRFGTRIGLSLERQSLVPFQRSLSNTIIRQNVLEELATVKVRTMVLFGAFDLFILRDYYKPEINTNPLVSFTQVKATHSLDTLLVPAIVRAVDELVK